ncbi:hypothetical protein VPH35_030604 [Triticum aestivum]
MDGGAHACIAHAIGASAVRACMRFQAAAGDRAQRFNKMVDMVFDIFLSFFLSFWCSSLLLLPRNCALAVHLCLVIDLGLASSNTSDYQSTQHFNLCSSVPWMVLYASLCEASF